MICEDIIGMEGLEGLIPVAGRKGLDRPLKWVYFADAMECLGDSVMDSSESFGEWINGGELIVITSERITGNADRLKQLMRYACEKEACGIAINTGQIPKAIADCADELGLPLFELSWSLKLVNLSQIICKAVFVEESNETSLDQILANLLYNGYDSESNLAYQALHFGFDLHRPCRIALFDLDRFAGYVKQHDLSEGELRTIKKDLQTVVKQQFRKYGIKKVMSLIQSDSVIVLFPSEPLGDESIRQCCGDIMKRFSNLHSDLTVSAGIGSSYALIGQFQQSLKEAVKAEKASSMAGKADRIMFFDEMGILAVYSRVDDEKILWDYYRSAIGKLISVDDLNGGGLMNTLEVYIACNLNAVAAAERLFIHRNTLRYRLNKIEQILNVDLEDFKTCVNLSNALQAKRFFELTGAGAGLAGSSQ
jgi:sugar diacid utilization regulator